ncbi:MAG: 16S rRNA (cytidine(1402)-2'-O)-methyltransferase [Pseudomonadota bacterium]
MKLEEKNTGVLYIVATPIGNLSDISERAIITLKDVDLIVAEDTRHSKPMLDKLGVSAALLSYHRFNEAARCDELIKRLLNGQSIALISDAGTPLISDPGYRLVRAAHHHHIAVSPIPGACAAVAALSVCGFDSEHFYFAGFLAAKSVARCQQLQQLKSIPAMLIFYESPHRILATLQDMAKILGSHRQALIAREITKRYEDIQRDRLTGLITWLQQDDNHQRGEFVIIIDAPEFSQQQRKVSEKSQQTLEILLEELPLKQAVELAAKLSDAKKNDLYQLALEMKNKSYP